MINIANIIDPKKCYEENGSLIIEMFPNVQQVTIKPFITENIKKNNAYI